MIPFKRLNDIRNRKREEAEFKRNNEYGNQMVGEPMGMKNDQYHQMQSMNPGHSQHAITYSPRIQTIKVRYLQAELKSKCFPRI